MQHSTVARYASWSGTRFAPSSARARGRRLGLRVTAGFIAAPSRHTVLRRPHAAPMTDLRASGHGLNVAPARSDHGLPRTTARMLWTRSDRGAQPRRSFAAPAWRA